MKKVKVKKDQKKEPMNKKIKILIYALAGVIALLSIMLILLESSSGYITVHNKSSRKLEYVKAYFVDMEGQFTETMLFEDLTDGDKLKLDLEKLDLSYREANLEVIFKFEGYDELFVDAGYFNDEFKGKITISFTDTEDEKVLLKIKASGGILPSPNISCNEEHIVNLEEGYVEE